MADAYRYRPVEGWGFSSGGQPMGGVVPDAAIDSKDHVYLTRRDPPAILVYDREGRFLSTLGEGIISNPHNIWIDPSDRLFCADVDDHTIRIFDTSGELLHTWGTPNRVGASDHPFNMPTKAMASATGEVFVSDGYGQHRVHRFSADGELELAWELGQRD